MKGSPSAQAITQPLTQRMADAESVFNHCGLEIIVPDSLLELPSGDKDNSITAEDWLKQARAPGERKAAFFGACSLVIYNPMCSRLMKFN